MKELWIGILIAWIAVPSFAASIGTEAGTVTGVTGGLVSGGDREMSTSSSVLADEKIETDEDGKAALLLGQDVVVELCASSAIVVEREEDGRRIVRVEAGRVRIVVEPSEGMIPIEIHTPAAIATILGTVVYVTVDPETGETTITSSDHDVEVRGIGPAAATPIRLRGGERTTVAWGGEPEKPRRLGAASMRSLGGCLGNFEEELRTLSLTRARQTRESSLVMESVVEDMLVGDELPPVAAPPSVGPADGSGSGPGNPPNPITSDPEPPFTIIDIATPDLDRMPPPCAGVPGEQCSF